MTVSQEQGQGLDGEEGAPTRPRIEPWGCSGPLPTPQGSGACCQSTPPRDGPVPVWLAPQEALLVRRKGKAGSWSQANFRF